MRVLLLLSATIIAACAPTTPSRGSSHPAPTTPPVDSPQVASETPAPSHPAPTTPPAHTPQAASETPAFSQDDQQEREPSPAAVGSPEAQPTESYVVTQTFSVDTAKLQLLQDARVPWDQVASDTIGGDPCSPIDGSPEPAFCGTAKPIRPAALRVLDSEGHETQRLTLDRPMATVVPTKLGRYPQLTYQVTVDLSSEFGSYSGPVTRFAYVRAGSIHWLTAIQDDGKVVNVGFMTSLKTAWRIVDTPGGGQEILSIACRPDFDHSPPQGPLKFTVTLRRFSYEGSQWRVHLRAKEGFWEYEEGTFPPRKSFP